jgi:cytochrome P450
VFIIVTKCLYNVYFHPLAQFPGPRLAKISNLWLFFKESRGHAHETILQWHKSNGSYSQSNINNIHVARSLNNHAWSFIRIAPNEISIKNQDAFLEIYRQGTPFLKASYWYRMFSPDGNNIFTTWDKNEHQQSKRLMSHAFSRTSILDHEDLIYSYTLPTMERIGDLVARGKKIPLFPALRRLTLDIITSFCFGNATDVDQINDFESPLFVPFDNAPRAVVAVRT